VNDLFAPCERGPQESRVDVVFHRPLRPPSWLPDHGLQAVASLQSIAVISNSRLPQKDRLTKKVNRLLYRRANCVIPSNVGESRSVEYKYLNLVERPRQNQSAVLFSTLQLQLILFSSRNAWSASAEWRIPRRCITDSDNQVRCSD